MVVSASGISTVYMITRQLATTLTALIGFKTCEVSSTELIAVRGIKTS